MSDNLDTLFAEPQTENEAHAIIDQIRFQHGILTDQDRFELSKTSQEFQRKSKAQAEQARKSVAAVTKIAATQLYSSRFRFIYELVQNADDSTYSCHSSKDNVPWIKFTIRPQLIIIESNENGFTVRDVLAICNTAQSSKQGNDNTIGAKGLGFKSVFAISKRVTIQSSLWSFEFKYPKGDDGLGMIAPHWNTPVALPSGVGTRITLHLNRIDVGFLEELSNAFADVPDTTLLFLRQVAKISISDEQTEYSTLSRVLARHDKWNAVEKSTSVNSKNKSTHLLYKMYQREFSVASSSTTDHEESDVQPSTTIELAFPVQRDSGLPSISECGQHIFAFLPMKRMAQLPFIIQADFDTAASREALADKFKNEQLRSSVSKLFSEAIETFCEHDDVLRYSWMQYVPVNQLDDFWFSLRSDILSNLKDKRLLIAEGDDNLHPIASLRVVPSIFRHQGEPLLPSKTYLSNHYDENAVKILKNLCLPTLKKDEMFSLIRRDLESGSESSIIRSTDLQDSWHTTFVDFLLEHFCSVPTLKQKLCNLSIIPLSSDQAIKWHRPDSFSGSIKCYFPRVDNHDLSPTLYPDLGLLLLHPAAYSLPERRDFYRNLGIGHAEPELVAKAVLVKNAKHDSKLVVHFIAHFAILFWYGTSAKSKLPSLWGVNDQCRIIASTRLYMHSHEPYSTSELLEHKIDHSDFGFINKDYLASSVKDHVRSDGETWKSWLMNTAGIRQYPCLTESDGEWKGLSPVFRQVVTKAPSKVIGTLEANWKEYKAQVMQSLEVLNDLKNAMVLCQNGSKRKLCQTILPTEETVKAGRLFGVVESLPYLQMEGDSNVVTAGDWSFLQTFDVCLTLTLRFHLEALEHLSNPFRALPQSKAPVLELYPGITSVATLREKEILQQFFCSRPAIYTSRGWRNISQCVWSGPDFNIEKVVLAKEYASHDFAQDLFVKLLEIEDATHDDILQELERLSKARLPASLEVTHASDIYKELELKIEWIHMTKDIRKTFETKALIYDGLNWQKLSSCVWSSAVQLRGKTILSRHYPDMSGFFKDRLGAKIMDTSMLIEELVRVCDNKATNKDEVKSLLREIATMLSNEDPTDKVDGLLRKLRDTKFLPLLDRTVANDGHDTAFATPKEPFYIGDDQRFTDAFKDKVDLLDFSAAEMNSFRPIFTALRLENRYISRRVQFETFVEGQDVDDLLTADLRLRCFAISCCVLSHKNPKEHAEYNHMHQKLVVSEVCTSSSMHTVFSLKHDESTFEVKSDIVLVKINMEGDRIRIVLPKNENDQRRCFRAHLPWQLLKFLGIFTPSAEKPMYRILNEPLSTLDDLLADEGIVAVEKLERRDQSVEQALVERLEAVQLHQASTQRAIVNGYDDSDDSSYTHHHPAGLDDIVDQHSPERFRKVLEHVVRQAQAVEDAPRTGVNGVVNYEPLSRADIGSTLMTDQSWQRIGVAGELFVLERLRALGVTGLNYTNWRSNIRHLVRDLPQYEHISYYHKAEISDIMYTDVSGNMEKIIGDIGFNRPTWPDSNHPHESIEFYIEVKTTINSCDDRFWVSKHQYGLLTEHALVRGQRPKIVYIIARVFNLLSPKINVRFFVDPKSLENSVLHFDWDKCAVTSHTGYF